jgi:hypothetical protein
MINSTELRKAWERRLPGLSAPWTHWRFIGDGELLGIVSGDHVSAALALLTKNASDYSVISVSRACLDFNGECRDVEVLVTHVADRRKDAILFGDA